MNIYLVSRTDDVDYDEYDSVVVFAETPAKAKEIYPDEYKTKEEWEELDGWSLSWVKYKDRKTLSVKLIGKNECRKREGVILASFNAG